MIRTIVCVAAFICSAMFLTAQDIRMADIPEGSFIMGSRGYGAVEEADEAPAHIVHVSAFRMSVTEITNAQYEEFDPSHRKLRGKGGFSVGDDEAVVYVSYHDAAAFCKWLSEKTGRNYRLPTEAEWEYACRAGTLTPFSTGTNKLPEEQRKAQKIGQIPKQVSLKTAEFSPNAWGLYDMHGNVEEWCLDWYAPYSPEVQYDPVVRSGEYKVTRGGSHNTAIEFLRSANRSAMIPSDKSHIVGFRIVEDISGTHSSEEVSAIPEESKVYSSISQNVHEWHTVSEPLFCEPIPYITEPEDKTVHFYGHNHCPAVTWCPNGDLLAIWFSADDESGREMTILSSRFSQADRKWSKPVDFMRIPDRNLTGSSLLYDGDSTIWHLNGVGAAGGWADLAVMLRKSHDNGQTWSAPEMVSPVHKEGNQVIAGLFITKEGWLIQPCDAAHGHTGGSVVHVSKDNGKTWQSPDISEMPEFEENGNGSRIAGIHAGVVQTKDGNLMAYGRNNNIAGAGSNVPMMPCSISEDGGMTWTYAPTSFNPIDSGQRLVLRRLNEGPLMLISFTNHPKDDAAGMEFKDENGNSYVGHGMFVALSFDDGLTWPVKKLLSAESDAIYDGRGWTGLFRMDRQHAEPMGYLAATQTPDNVIHLLSSGLHYRFNLAWIMK